MNTNKGLASPNPGRKLARAARASSISLWLSRLAHLRRRRRRGQALVEFTLVAAILSIILLGIIELVTMYGQHGYLSDGSRAGVRLASLNYGDTDIVNAVMRPLNAHNINTIHNGRCDIQRIEIYDANPDGSVLATTTNNANNPTWAVYPNVPAGTPVEDVYYLTPNNSGSCDVVVPSVPTPYTQDNYLGPSHYFPPDQRINPAPVGSANTSVGVSITYLYWFRTPVLAAFGRSFQMSYSTVQALGGDNANNFLGLSTPTPIFTWTPTNTPTITPTPTDTVTPTRTASPTSTPSSTPTPPATATWNNLTPTYTPTMTPVNTSTPTSTSTGTVTSTPAATPTITLTPMPIPQAQVNNYPCVNGYLLYTGIRLSWTSLGPGVVYHVYYRAPGGSGSGPTPTPVTTPVSTDELAGSPVSSTNYPVSGDYNNVSPAIGGYWYVIAQYPDGTLGPPGIVDVVTACTAYPS